MRRAALLLLLLALGAQAAVETYQFANEQQRQRYLEFTRELRCPKCQNQNLADSNAPIAADLRRELHRLLGEGKSDAEIVDFMVSRYGEYVLYKPRLEPKTWLLWAAPVLMLLGGGVVLARVLRRARAMRDQAAEAALSEAERARLAALLDREEPPA
jgi:cytochrome c-type biogenesis protein CcmH